MILEWWILSRMQPNSKRGKEIEIREKDTDDFISFVTNLSYFLCLYVVQQPLYLDNIELHLRIVSIHGSRTRQRRRTIARRWTHGLAQDIAIGIQVHSGTISPTLFNHMRCRLSSASHYQGYSKYSHESHYSRNRCRRNNDTIRSTTVTTTACSVIVRTVCRSFFTR